MRLIFALILFALPALCGPKYVDNWPDRLVVVDGVAFKPTTTNMSEWAAMCRTAGYELKANRPKAEVDAAIAAQVAADQAAAVSAAQAAQAAQVAANIKTQRIEAVRGKYRATTKALCREVGVAETNVLEAASIESLVLPLLDDGDTTSKNKRNTKIIAYLVQLEYLTRILEKEDGADALDHL